MSDVTKILSQIESGDARAAEHLLPLVYEELRRLAAAKLSNEKPGQTLQATALVHEAYVRLLGTTAESCDWNSRGHFFGAAAEAMRRILVENARRKKRLRHGGDHNKVSFEKLDVAAAEPTKDVVALSEALDRLAVDEPVVADLVKLRYFAGLTIAQAAEALQVSVRTANRHWAYAKAWLFQELSE